MKLRENSVSVRKEREDYNFKFKLPFLHTNEHMSNLQQTEREGNRMKFLHLGDLHIGKSMGEFNLIHDQRFILDQILDMAKEQEVDDFWQHNDCWPVASWASRDYYGRWKAQHYFARKAYRDILVSPITDEDEVLNIQVVSDRLKSCNGTLQVEVMKLTGEKVNSYKRNIKIDANSNT